MRVKKLAIGLLASAMLVGSSFTSMAAGAAYVGGDAWQRIMLPWDDDVDYTSVTDVEFSTKDSEKPSCAVVSQGILVTNLYHPGVDGTEKIKVTFSDGETWEREISYDASGVNPAVSGGAQAPVEGEFDIHLAKDSNTTVKKLYVDDVEVTGWTQSDTAVKMPESVVKSLMSGEHIAFLTLEQGDIMYYNFEVKDHNRAAVSSEAVVMAGKYSKDATLAWNKGSADDEADAVTATVRNGAALVENTDFSISDDVIYLREVVISKLEPGMNYIDFTITPKVTAGTVTTTAAVFVKPLQRPVLLEGKATFNKGAESDLIFQLSMGEYELDKLKIGQVEVTSANYELDGPLCIVKKSAIDSLTEGNHVMTLVTTDSSTFDVGVVEVINVVKKEPKLVAAADPIKGLTVPMIIEIDFGDYTFESANIDGSDAIVQYQDGKLSIPAEVINNTADGTKVKLNFTCSEGKAFAYEFEPYTVTMGYAESISVNPKRHTFYKGSEIPLVVETDKPYNAYKALGRSKYQAVTWEAENALDVGTKITIPPTFFKEIDSDSEIFFIFYNTADQTQSDLLFVNVVAGKGPDEENPGGNEGEDNKPEDTSHKLTPESVTYDKRDKGDVEFSCETSVKSYVISGNINGKDVVRTGTCTTPVIPEAVLQNLENGVYSVKFMCTDDKETTVSKLVLTKSGTQTGSTEKDTSDWSYPGKRLPNRVNALGGGQTSGGSSGGSSSSSSTSTSVTYPSIDINSLALLTTDHAGWEKQADGRWRFKDAQGNYRASTYLVTPSGAYVIDGNGYMLTGWFTNSIGQWLYADMVNGDLRDGWQEVGGVWYYLATKDDTTHTWGTMYVNERTPDGYTVNASGAWVQ